MKVSVKFPKAPRQMAIESLEKEAKAIQRALLSDALAKRPQRCGAVPFSRFANVLLADRSGRPLVTTSQMPTATRSASSTPDSANHLGRLARTVIVNKPDERRSRKRNFTAPLQPSGSRHALQLLL